MQGRRWPAGISKKLFWKQLHFENSYVDLGLFILFPDQAYVQCK